MSEENVELVKRMHEAVNRGDFEGAVALANPPPEFEFVPSGGSHPRSFGSAAGT
jgi:hypothetical protein